MTPAPGAVVAKRFRLIRELGTGNMGSVWLAHHLGLDAKCAVKLMANAALNDASSRTRFQLEAKAIATLQSPNIVRVLDYDVDEDTPFIAMELLEGEELAVRLYRLGCLDANATHHIVAQIARGLSKAHGAGIVHRDLKPENIFLARTDDGEIAKLLDFGIAKAAFPGADTGTLAGAVLGTPQYMSPEQVRGASDIDHRADLWSLAVVAFECLLGRLPFDSQTLGDVFAQIVADPMPVPSRVAPPGVRIPPAFDRWWARAASRDVAGRFTSAQELSDALGKALGIGDARMPDTTMSPLAISSTGAGRDLVLPVRRSGRVRFVVAAAAVAVSVMAIAGHVRSGSGAALGSEPAPTPRAAVAPVVARPPGPPAERVVAPASSSGEDIPLVPSSAEHAVCDPHADAKTSSTPRALSRPPARTALPARPSGSTTPGVRASGRPSEDVDFGI